MKIKYVLIEEQRVTNGQWINWSWKLKQMKFHMIRWNSGKTFQD